MRGLVVVTSQVVMGGGVLPVLLAFLPLSSFLPSCAWQSKGWLLGVVERARERVALVSGIGSTSFGQGMVKW